MCILLEPFGMKTNDELSSRGELIWNVKPEYFAHVSLFLSATKYPKDKNLCNHRITRKLFHVQSRKVRTIKNEILKTKFQHFSNQKSADNKFFTSDLYSQL